MNKSKAIVQVLSTHEKERLHANELIIGQGLKAFVAVGLALLEVREDGLYREEYKTFEEYCKKRWKFSGRRGEQLMAAAQIAEKTRTGCSGLIIENESQARTLSMVPQHLRDEVLERIKEQDQKITEQNVTKAVNHLLEQKRAEAKEREALGEEEPEEEAIEEPAAEEPQVGERQMALRAAAAQCEKERLYRSRGEEHLRLSLKDLQKTNEADFRTAEARQSTRESLDRADEVFSFVRGLIATAEGAA